MTDDQIREVFLANGFTIKEGQTDLKPYVYAAARALLSLAAPPAALAVDWQHTLAEAREAVEERWEQSNTLHDHALLQRIDGLLAASPADQVSKRDVKILLDWIEEAVEYVGCKTWSPSLERDGRKILAKMSATPPAIE